MLNALLDTGINYIDTAESYGNGQAETTIGRVLKKHDRKKIFVTTKQLVTEHPGMPVKKEDVTKQAIIERFRKSLQRLQTDYADCLMMHGGESLEDVKHEGFHAAVTQLKADGHLKYVGISHHGSYHRLGSKEPLGKVLLAAAEDGRFDGHACGLCEPHCPRKVPVNTIMRYNHYFAAQGREKYAMERYAKLDSRVADQCRHCTGACESACPYNVPVQTLLTLAHQNLTLA